MTKEKERTLFLTLISLPATMNPAHDHLAALCTES
ncbi:hypothetical protein Mpal_2440 [Methanosphaerula palustris E1-9c]|uniref:Uncharacterized protein n=1 Tax=Methanosphaerula palustris (strain ATCC BAA-1556 / DSM 19958 / E1-9c) TaxID=521011 RepID=B8GEL8_METPE|nr:hypothetical protein Mpal_2440 [Methanosphaerula palustris E1-9c]